MEDKRRDHPLALLFWTQIVFAYAFPAILEIAFRLRGGTPPGRNLVAFAVIYPFTMVSVALIVVGADLPRIFAYANRTRRRLPGFVVGAIYAVAAFVGLALARSGVHNATMAWSDYVVDGATQGLLVLLLALVIEVFAALVFLCHLAALARHWRRLARPQSPQAAE